MGLKAPPAEYVWAVSGGLLASSCCVLQLVFNAMSVGCAGFSVLTPYRPAFLAVTAVSLAYTHSQYRDRRRTVLSLALAISLASTPELVQWYNKRSWCWPYVLCEKGPGVPDHLELEVVGLKCVSCAMRLKQHLQARLSQQNGTCQIDFATGRALITGLDIHLSSVVAAVEELGYSAISVKQKQTQA